MGPSNRTEDKNMTQYEMTEKLAEKCNVTLEAAKAALEASDWNMLTATHLLEAEAFRRMQELNEVASGCDAAVAQAVEDEGAEEEAVAEAVMADEAEPEAVMADEVEADAQAETAENAGDARRARARRHRHSGGFRNLGEHIRRLIACGNRNRFEVRKGDEALLELPVTVMVIMLLCAFWVCVPLLVIGLFAGCRYSFRGRELGREDINSALNKAADAADHLRESAAKA